MNHNEPCKVCGLPSYFGADKHYGCPGEITSAERSMVEYIRKYAHDNYEKGGWDFVVECWEDKDIVEVIRQEKILTMDKLITAIGSRVGVHEERRNEVIGTSHEFNCSQNVVVDHPDKPFYKLCVECGHYWQSPEHP